MHSEVDNEVPMSFPVKVKPGEKMKMVLRSVWIRGSEHRLREFRVWIE